MTRKYMITTFSTEDYMVLYKVLFWCRICFWVLQNCMSVRISYGLFLAEKVLYFIMKIR